MVDPVLQPWPAPYQIQPKEAWHVVMSLAVSQASTTVAVEAFMYGNANKDGVQKLELPLLTHTQPAPQLSWLM